MEWKYLQPEITALEEAAKEALRAIGTEAKKNVRGEDWNLIEEYIERCLQKFQSVFELPLRSE